MKNKFKSTQIRKGGLLLSLLFLILAGCSKNYHQYEAVFYPASNELAKYEKIIVINHKKGNFAYDMMENALKSKLTEIIPGNVKPTKSITAISRDISMLKYTPIIDMLDDKKIAYLSFEVSIQEDIQHIQESRNVRLSRCNYLKKKKPCHYSGTATLVGGKQQVQVMLMGKIILKNSAGRDILPVTPFKSIRTDSGRIVQTYLSLTRAASNQVASDYAKKIIPFKQAISSELLTDGDSVAVIMIQKQAYNLAINRLEKIVANKDEEPKGEDYYHLGMAYEAVHELPAATQAYEKAQELSPNEGSIQIALQRIKNIKSH
ncbi:MAG: hypothetical protein COB67_10545 [SAR324 cluster bacterium]|uniref:Uncharacterized protein n=1 Tax=SAR324 cluster bacterium TaxID=2024889 RepID=A0A2A4SXN4_9DELT|nr:MAG: hypothetical protein COB67_10545 [SAR324 cluster bacterium]